jgi:hypothetical protein
MVHFPPLPSRTYEFSTGYSGMSQSGFPHSEIPGSKPACGSPRLIAACHVLRRLLAPRHSPYALSSLTKCSLHLTANMWSKNYRLQIIQLSKTLVSSLARAQQTCVVRLRCFAASAGQPSQSSCLACPAEALTRLEFSSQTLASRRLVENTGIEPVTSWLQTRRSPS